MRDFEIINEIIKDKGLKKVDVKTKMETFLGEEIVKSTFYNYLTGERRIQDNHKIAFSKALDEPLSKIFSDDDTLVFLKEMMKNPSQEIINIVKNSYPMPSNDVIYLDKLDMRAGAGAAGIIDVPREGNRIALDKLMLNGLYSQHLKVIEVIGDSMQPEYNEGDIALIDMVDGRYDFKKISGMYIVRVGDVVHIKRIEFLPNDRVRLISINKAYGDILPHKEGYEYEILGKVCGKIRIEKGLTFYDQGIK